MDSARRTVPVAKPVVVGGVRYEPLRAPQDHGFGQHGGIVAAVEADTGRILWTVQLYTSSHDAAEERDLQDVYARTLSLDGSGKALPVIDTRRRRWSLDLATRAVTRVHDGPFTAATPPGPS